MTEFPRSSIEGALWLILHRPDRLRQFLDSHENGKELFQATRDPLAKTAHMRRHLRPSEVAFYWAALFFAIGTGLKLLGYQ
jgi:hypothetical protein